ncbi:trimethylamine methyltransferase family protein [bacterium]|nr:trimethylamine methyltransferase family protein [bacterium]
MKKLTETQVRQIKVAAEDLLEDVGFSVTHREIQRCARKVGAYVDKTCGRIQLPRTLLRELLTHVPSRYTIRGLTGSEATVGDGTPRGLAIVTDPWILDYNTGRLRRPRLEDVRRHTIIARKLACIDSISRMDFPVVDVDGPASSWRALEEHLLHHTKHYMVMPADIGSFERWLDIGRILLRGAELKGSGLLSVGVAVVSPLVLNDLNAELLIRACGHGFAVVPTVCPMAGTTSPYSMAATLAQGNAECIFIAALAQMLNPGNPVLHTFGPSVTDMQSGYDRYYTLDKALWKMAGVQIGHAYGMPAAAECGGTMAGRYDLQSGAEGMLFMKAAHDSGADVLSGFGSCCNAVGMSAEMMLIQTAWLEAARYLGQGIGFDDFNQGLHSLTTTCPGGNYLTDELTLKNLRSCEFFSHRLFDYAGCGSGSGSMLARAHEMAEDMASETESPVPGDIQENLRRYFHDLYRSMGA